MDMNNREGIDCGQEGWAGWKKAKGKNQGNCDIITITFLITKNELLLCSLYKYNEHIDNKYYAQGLTGEALTLF